MSRLLETLRKAKDNKGMMANLRCILVPSKMHRAWPALNRLGVAIDDKESSFVAGLYALHPEESSNGNLGGTTRDIEHSRGDKRTEDNKLTATERRFQYLLCAERDELLDRVLRIVLMAKSHGIPVNYEQLLRDIRYWGERIKTEWAKAFWTPSATLASKEDA